MPHSLLVVAHHLAGRDIDDVARGRIDQLSVDAEHDPEDVVRRIDARNLLGVVGVAEDVDLVEQRIRYPDFLAVGREGNAVAGTAMGDPRPGRAVPDRAPVTLVTSTVCKILPVLVSATM